MLNCWPVVIRIAYSVLLSTDQDMIPAENVIHAHAQDIVVKAIHTEHFSAVYSLTARHSKFLIFSLCV